ncbi:type VI secretion system-associated FHA domain protein TagH [Variovorax ginsengisoli]|uniref:FHA domain-containing protein n=1 Tax=Variovorax ginsengisoli TaxID=363844 RepID=A0ABT9S9I9_9BURK|nr:type VI secretion system-associated FHA domain protein TagH [Variovorax ginsengisoli]MDP9901032.1 FHA domain-containing protein [Variovorax ginsengisoli]
MINLTVISLHGAPITSAPSAGFDELGGTIGRADTNQLVLPDPDRTISRVHAQVVYRSGAYAIVDRGSNPILVNGQPVGSGREMPIRPGDQVQIGGFVLEVRAQAATAAAVSDDPFADLLGSAGGARTTGGLVDPLASLGFADVRPAPAPAPSARPAAGGIPDDWDPFAPDAPSARSGVQDFAQSLGRQGGHFGLDASAAAPVALIPDLPAGNDHSLDALFGLKPGSGGDDPLANSRLAAPMAAPNMAANHDPMQSLNSAPRASGQAQADAVSELNLPFLPPPATEHAPAPPVPAGAVLSWDIPEGDGRTVIRASIGAIPAPSAEASKSPDPLAAFDGFAEPAPAPAPVPETLATVCVAAPPPVPASAHGDTLLAAFREGLGVPGLQVEQMTPELMHLIGELLHESAQGTVDLLVARAALKREVRAEATMIVAQKNNPLKFSPSGEAALQHLLSPPMRGFMEPVPAMRDAFNDLRAHQFGFVAGMRAALAGVLERFKPSELEGRLQQRSVLRSLLPGSRKAAMWEVFTEHYAQISTEAEDDFHTLFGKAFLKAYEEHIAQLQKDRA